MHQISVTGDALFFVTGSGVYDGTVSQHGPPIVWHIQNIAVAFLALLVFERRIGRRSVFGMIVFPQNEMGGDILDAVKCLGEEEIGHILGRGKMAVHTVRDKSLPVVDVG